MTRKYVLTNALVINALVAILAFPIVALAHGGHVHKVMGTVTAIENSQLSVRTQDGKTVTIVVND